MPKATKANTTSALAQAVRDAQSSDVEVGRKSNESGRDVAARWDALCPKLNWTTVSYNGSAASNNIPEKIFSLLKELRTEYRDAWNGIEGSKNFDQRWQYVRKQSMHYKPKSANDESAGKSTEAKLEEAIRAVHRHATTLEAQEEIDLALELMSLRCIVLKTAEE